MATKKWGRKWTIVLTYLLDYFPWREDVSYAWPERPRSKKEALELVSKLKKMKKYRKVDFKLESPHGCLVDC